MTEIEILFKFARKLKLPIEVGTSSQAIYEKGVYYSLNAQKQVVYLKIFCAKLRAIPLDISTGNKTKCELIKIEKTI